MSSHNLNDVKDSFKSFEALDYGVFAVMLIVSSCIGLYFGVKDKRKHKEEDLSSVSPQSSEEVDYLLGGKNMHAFPVAMSLVATSVSGIALLGESSEVYVYGLQYACILVGQVMMGVFTHFVTIPVFFDLNIISMFQYLQKRFDMKMRLFGSLVSSLSTVIYHAIVIYGPALAFNQTTGIDIEIITPVLMAVCVFYTCLGGIKAVIWTDVIQIGFMVAVMILIIVKGTIDVGGLSVVIDRNLESSRIEMPDFRINPTIRHTFWSLTVGGSCFWTIVSVNQGIIQRYLSLNDKQAAKQASAMYVTGLIVLLIICVTSGLVIYATFYDCDPLSTKLAKAQDQLLPLLVMRVLRSIPGCAGLFVAGVSSAALSTLSSGLNSMSALVLEDYCKPMFKNGISKKASGFIMRGTVLVLGVISVGLVYVVQHLGSVLQLSMSFSATFLGSLFGVFAIGMFLPWIGKRAAFYGLFFGTAVMIHVVFRAQLDIASGVMTFERKVTSIEGCTYNYTVETPIQHADGENLSFHNISYLYYLPLGAIITCLSSVIFSLFFGFEDPRSVDPRLLVPFMRKHLETKISDSVTSSRNESNEGVKENFEMVESRNKL